ncbi:MAG: SprB repeat-containing protein, partial [Bacteroidota bacterium]
HTISGGMVERVPGEFWYATNESQGPDNDALMGRVFVYKGIYNSTTQQTDWVQATVITPNNFLSDGTNAQLSTPNIAFSPDGMIGYIAWLGDLNGGQDSVLSPVVVETTDGGQSWGTPIEIGLQQFPEIADSLQSALFVVDSVGPMQFDTMPFATGVATTGFDLDMTVDANGVPYLFTTVGAAATVNSPVGEYTIFSGIHLMNLAFTKDQFDDWNAIYVNTQNTFRGWFGDLSAQGAQQIAQDIHNQVSRSEDGTQVFFLWVDTDSTALGWSPIPSFPGGNNMTNFSPDLRLRSYDVNKREFSPLNIVTEGDLNWGGLVLLPKVSPIAHDMGADSFRIPTVIANIDGGSALSTTSYHYIEDVTIDVSTASEPAIFFYNCKEDPFSNVVNELTPDCGSSNGSLSLTAGGGTAPYQLLWNTNDTSTTISGLSAGLYELVVTDDNGCTDTLNIILNNANAPTINIDPVSVADVSCNGANDGTASVVASGGTGSLTYTWSNSETAATAINLPPGTTTVSVTDSLGCQSFTDVTITEPDPIMIDISSTSIDCAGNVNGTVSALAQGGTGMISYDWGSIGMG